MTRRTERTAAPSLRARARPVLLDRAPGHESIERCLRAQGGADPRSRRARLMGASPLRPAARADYADAAAQLVMADRLDALDPDLLVLHSVVVDDRGERTVVDHVVIGPSGVHVLLTRAHPGGRVWAAGRALLVDGVRSDGAADAARSAEAVRRVLAARGAAVPVIPALVVDGARGIDAEPSTVAVIAAQSAVEWLRTRPVLLDADTRDLVVELTSGEPWDETARRAVALDDARRRFSRLRRSVRSAARRRVGAIPAAATALVAGSALLFSPEARLVGLFGLAVLLP